ncbi:MAG: RNA polymerase sigma factor, partial [Acidimicrobiia bacterium]
RNAATDRHRRMRRLDLRDAVPEGPPEAGADHGALSAAEQHLVSQAFQTLPARWRTVLWLTAVEGLSPVEVAGRIGLTPAAVAALAYRSRQGLRRAYLQLHDVDAVVAPSLTAAA